jgi:hypothetical protein
VSTKILPKADNCQIVFSSDELVMTKKLMLIPIVHSEKEMGSLKSDISEMIDRKFGKEKRLVKKGSNRHGCCTG